MPPYATDNVDGQNSISPVVSIKDGVNGAVRQREWLLKIRHGPCNTYGRLSSAMIISNVIPLFVVLAVRFHDTTDPRSVVRTLIPVCIHMASANAMICTAIRSPPIINLLFLIFGSIPRTAPLWLRRRCCKIFHFGGVHSGTGISICIWFLAYVLLLSLAETWQSPRMAYIYTTSVLLTLLLLAIVIVAIPSIRRRHHNFFELIHRFAGWMTLVLFWVLLGLHARDEVVTGGQLTAGVYLLRFPAFWFLSISTLSAIWPWAMLRKVKLEPERLSDHAARLHFRHRPASWGRGLSLARHPLKDWHSFASFTDQFDNPNHNFSCLVSNAGDWTRSVIDDRPTELWVRAIPVCGLGYVMKVFNRVVVVATGSGIGPCLSFIGYRNMPLMRVAWQTRSPLRTYGQGTLDLVKRLDPNPLIYDTDQTGRVEMLPIACNMVEAFHAEAVIVISNPLLTRKLVYGLEVRGIPAYGPIFDS